jgi:hypothetical protein
MRKQIEQKCKFCGDPIRWVMVRFGHGPHYEYKSTAIDIVPHSDGLIAAYQEEFHMRRRNEIYKTPENLRFRHHGSKRCLQERAESA